VSTPDPADAPSQRSRLDDARDRARRAGDWANERVPGATLLNVALERERIAAAGLIAGGLAYRLFFWLLPLGLVIAAVLSFWVDADRLAAADAAHEFGMSATAVQSAMNAIAEQHHARWYFLLAGIALVVWFGSGVVRALHVAHSVAWGIRPARLRRPMTAGLVFSGIVALLIAVSASTQLLRAQLGGTGLWLTLFLAAFYLGSVLWIMDKLPHRSDSRRDLLPGALLVAFGAQVIHLAVVLYLAPKIGRSSELYGALGAATVILLWLYLIARLIVASAFLNAALWHRAHPDDAEAGTPTRVS
jgi:membrane protein